MSDLVPEQSSEIAIIGMTCRFPGARGVSEFWQNLQAGVESISFFSDQELEAVGVAPAVLNDPNYVKASPVLEEVELFDAPFFAINPREAELMDPQNRLFLECAWEALESASYVPEMYEGRIGVYGGAGINAYFLYNIAPYSDLLTSSEGFQAVTMNDKDYLSTRVSYKLNLKGPSITVQTACSTSLVAVHLACESLLNSECDMALAGGVAVNVPMRVGYFYAEGLHFSPDGHCRSFDAQARGTVFGSGVGIVVLKRLADALADGDCIHAVIKGSAVNNDGSLKVGYTAPSVDGQAAVIAEALEVAEVNPETVTYIEAHGSATELGDPVEVAAMIQAFRLSTEKKGFCAIGSVKTNFGHLGTAAGAAGLLKTILAIEHGMIPPSLNFEQPNPEIDFANSPFYVNTELCEWKVNGHPRRAGVSSFGMGGTNAHVVLEQAPKIEPSSQSRRHQLFLLSAKTKSALEIATTDLVARLRDGPTLNPADVAYTLQVGRTAFNHRRAVVCHSLEDGVEALATSAPHRVLTVNQTRRARPVAFVFPGVGDHYVGMAQELYQTELVFQEWVDRCCTLLEPLLECDLRDVLYPHRDEPMAAEQTQGLDLHKMLGRQTGEASENPLQQTVFAQPAVFVIEHALAQLLVSWGIQPSALIGYSLGEYTAACLAGVLSLEDALKLVARRAQMIQALERGAMLTVSLSEDEVQPFLGDEVTLTGVLTPSVSVLGGSLAAITALSKELTSQEIGCRLLPTTHAFHSPMMTPIRDEFTRLTQTVSLSAPEIPYLSNVTGDWITPTEATDPTYWARHLCQTVQFSSSVDKLLKNRDQVLLEMGPGQSLGSFVRQHPDCQAAQASWVLPTIRYSYDEQSDSAFLLKTLAKLWLAGVEIDWVGFHRYERRHRLSLPTYPFEGKRYWLEFSQRQREGQATGEQIYTSAEGIKALPRQEVSDWFYLPTWRQIAPRAPLLTEEATGSTCWVLFVDRCGLGNQVETGLLEHNQHVVTVHSGSLFKKLGKNRYQVQPRSRTDYETLLGELRQQGLEPDKIVHMWSVTDDESTTHGLDLERTLDLGLYSLMCLAQAVGEMNLTSCEISVVSSQLQIVTPDERLDPRKATVIGACRVIPLEYSGIACRCVDVALPTPGSWQAEALMTNLLSVLETEVDDVVIALRGHQCWVQTFEPINLPPVGEGTPSRLRSHGVYLITGGLGGIGLALAEHLARTLQARLILLSRSGLPPRAEWAQILAAQGDEDGIGRKIRHVQHLEELGAEVLAVAADVANEGQVRVAVEQAVARFDTIHGVVHAAGVPGMGLIQFKTPEMVAEVLAPKVKGTLVLGQVLREQEIALDFVVLFSSIASVIGGGPGQVGYCAANAFMDAYAQRHVENEWLTISIDWAEWQWNAWKEGLTGFGDKASAFFIENRRQFGITFEEGSDALERILSHRLPQVIVSTQDLHEVNKLSKNFTVKNILDWGRGPGETREEHSHLGEVVALHPRPELMTTYTAPTNEVEERIAGIWQGLLGIELIGINDNFLELGGHSLIAVQVISRLRQLFQVDLPLSLVLTAPTVADLAVAVEMEIIKELQDTEQKAEQALSSAQVA
jgi:acyl transferase domain-containing protein/acyl carrier protein